MDQMLNFSGAFFENSSKIEFQNRRFVELNIMKDVQLRDSSLNKQ